MRHKFYSLSVALVIFATVLGISGFQAVFAKEQAHNPRKIVTFQENFLNSHTKDELIAKAGGVKIKDLDLIDGAAVYLPSKASEKALAHEAGVLRVEDDAVAVALGKPRITSQPAEVLPWGIDRIDAELSWGSTTGDPIKVAVVDTGIDLTHPDLAANIKGGINTINPQKSPNDDNGHGTHVAGTIGALDNTIGVIGVGPQIDLYAVKVLGKNGSGFLSDVIEGLDWAVANHMQVVNMSLGASVDIQAFHDAVIRANSAGIVEVAAAGNSGGAVGFPAAYPEVIAVSATDTSNNIASFSSRGPEVDLAAPGVSIYSTYKGSTYRTLSGTSMASPHVAGAAALVLTTPVGAFDADSDGVWDPAEVQGKLEARATDLGTAGKDNLYGSGLVNAFSAISP